MTHRTTIRTRFYELDPYGHVNHAVYVQWFEVARVELLDEAGLSLAAMQANGLHFIVAELTIRYVRPIVFGDTVVIETELAELKRVSGRWHQRMFRDDALCAEQNIRVAVTTADGRPYRLGDEWVRLLEPYRARMASDGSR